MVFYRWEADEGLVCKVHARPCVFQWVPWLVQEELFEYLDYGISVSGLDEDEAPTVSQTQ